jgi:hypothetical protein
VKRILIGTAVVLLIGWVVMIFAPNPVGSKVADDYGKFLDGQLSRANGTAAQSSPANAGEPKTWLSTSLPSESFGKQIIESEMQRQSQGLLRLVSFEKVNGMEINPAGVKTYMLEFKSVIEFQDNCMWSGTFRTAGDGILSLTVQRGHVDGIGAKKRKGDRVTFTDSLGFQKTERGWRWVQ